jgi:5-methylcytosine-specific restriction endonuclease McrA
MAGKKKSFMDKVKEAVWETEEETKLNAAKEDRKRLTAGVKRQLIEAVGGHCEQAKCKHKEGLEIHHIVPVKEGGMTKPGNLIVLCPNHHTDVKKVPRSDLKKVLAARTDKVKKSVQAVMRGK